jgi:transcriptional regulator with XRE-family HTH domain
MKRRENAPRLEKGGVLDEVRRLRKLKGLTQVELAKLAGVSAYTITEIETGHREPRPSTLRKLAGALDADVADFFPKAPAPSPEPATVAALPEEEQRGLAVLYRELARKGRSIEQSLRSGEQQDFEGLKELDLAHALLAKKRGKRDIRGKELDELAEAQDELLDVKASISRMLEQELFENLDDEQRAQVEAFKIRQAHAFRTEAQVMEKDTA